MAAEKIVIRDDDLQNTTLNGLMDVLNARVNELLENYGSSGDDGAAQPQIATAVVAALITAGATVFSSAVGAAAGAAGNVLGTASVSGDRKARYLKLTVNTDKWFFTQLNIGVQEVYFVCPPADIDVTLIVSMYNQNDRATWVSSKLVPVGDIDDFEVLLETLGEVGSPANDMGYIATSYLTPGNTNLLVDFLGSYPEVYISSDVNNVYAY